jgi:hypothetical protein
MWVLIKSIEPYSSTKGTLREEVCSRLIKPTTQVYLGNVGLLTGLTNLMVDLQKKKKKKKKIYGDIQTKKKYHFFFFVCGSHKSND